MKKALRWLNDNGPWIVPLLFVTVLFLAVSELFRNPGENAKNLPVSLVLAVLYILVFEKRIFPKILTTKLVKRFLPINDYRGLTSLLSNPQNPRLKIAFLIYMFLLFAGCGIILLVIR